MTPDHPTSDYMNSDAVMAAADLADRTGAKGFELGYIHDNVPLEEAGWYAHATFQGARIQVQDHRSPSAAALALAERLLAGGLCRCGRRVTLNDQTSGCRWQLMGKRWEAGCVAASIRIDGPRGDLDGMNRAMRRAHQRGRR